jgi:SAM-dependent methyltransferase
MPALAEAASARSRRAKFDLFMELMRPDASTRVLDVGVDDVGQGEASGFAAPNFFEDLYPWPEQVTAVALHAGERFRAAHPRVRFVQADGCDLPFEDGAFDVYFSNAVVEHVGGRDRQRRFVAEALRVARRVFLATPNRRFPLEVHTKLPLVHWLPAPLAGKAYELAGKPWARELDLLTPGALAGLFPPAAGVRIVRRAMTLVAVTGP